MLAWRDALLDGRLPRFEETKFPARVVHDSITKTLESMGLARFCRQNTEVTDRLLHQIIQLAESSSTRADEALGEMEFALGGCPSPMSGRLFVSRPVVTADETTHRIDIDCNSPTSGLVGRAK